MADLPDDVTRGAAAVVRGVDMAGIVAERDAEIAALRETVAMLERDRRPVADERDAAVSMLAKAHARERKLADRLAAVADAAMRPIE